MIPHESTYSCDYFRSKLRFCCQLHRVPSIHIVKRNVGHPVHERHHAGRKAASLQRNVQVGAKIYYQAQAWRNFQYGDCNNNKKKHMRWIHRTRGTRPNSRRLPHREPIAQTKHRFHNTRSFLKHCTSHSFVQQYFLICFLQDFAFADYELRAVCIHYTHNNYFRQLFLLWKLINCHRWRLRTALYALSKRMHQSAVALRLPKYIIHHPVYTLIHNHSHDLSP